MKYQSLRRGADQESCRTAAQGSTAGLMPPAIPRILADARKEPAFMRGISVVSVLFLFFGYHLPIRQIAFGIPRLFRLFVCIDAQASCVSHLAFWHIGR